MVAAALAAAACAAPLSAMATAASPKGPAAKQNVSDLRGKLGAARSQLSGDRRQEQMLAASVSVLGGRIASLVAQVSLVRSRESEARGRLAAFEAKLVALRAAAAGERRHLARLRQILGQARAVLAAELVGRYEQPQQSLVSAIVDSSGFQQLLDRIQYLSRTQHQEQSTIRITRLARAQAQGVAFRLSTLRRTDAAAADAARTQADALSGMNALLASRESALAHEQAAQKVALAVSRARGARLAAAVAIIRRQEAEAQAAQRAVVYNGASAGSSAGWAVPYAVVLCESGAQNLPPNGAGASGYYQIIPGTWREFGGTGPAAYLAPKSEQDAVAARIWNGGAGAGNWACAAIVGIV